MPPVDFLQLSNPRPHHQTDQTRRRLSAVALATTAPVGDGHCCQRPSAEFSQARGLYANFLVLAFSTPTCPTARAGGFTLTCWTLTPLVVSRHPLKLGSCLQRAAVRLRPVSNLLTRLASAFASARLLGPPVMGCHETTHHTTAPEVPPPSDLFSSYEF